MVTSYAAYEGVCLGCDKGPQPLFDVGAYDGSKFCWECLSKYGVPTLQAACNAALAVKEAPAKEPRCLRCGQPMLIGARHPMCQACQKVYQDRFGKGVKFL